MKIKYPLVAVVGRPNVGKSTLFNRITRSRHAIVDDRSGVTRDRHYQPAEWAGREFYLMDTGGYVPDSRDQFELAIREQAAMGIEEADVVLFLVDVKTGVADIDQHLARLFVRSGKPTLLVVNKVDNEKLELETGEFYQLGLGDPWPVSAQGGRGVGDMLDHLVEQIPDTTGTPWPENTIHLAILGKPNVGKSSLVNTLLGEERMIVTPVAGTTRDSTDSLYRYQNRTFNLIDTAGLRRRTKVKESIEFYSNLRTHQAILRCDVAMIMMDATDQLTAQDTTIINQVVESGKGLILVYNKWDLIEKDSHTAKKFRDDLVDQIPNLKYIPLEFVSVHEKQRLLKLMDRVLEVQASRDQMIPADELKEWLDPLIERTPHPSRNNRFITFPEVRQLRTRPTVFQFRTRYPSLVSHNYIRFLEKKIRTRWPLAGVPVKLEFLQKFSDSTTA